MPRQALTERQRIFARELVYSACSQTQAAIAAGYSEDSAGRAGTRLAQNAHVKAEIERLRSRMERKAEARAAFTRDNALQLLAELAQDEENAPRDRIAALRAIADLEAWNTPTRSEHVTVHADIRQLLEGSGLTRDDLRALAFPAKQRRIAAPPPSVIDADDADITSA